MEIQAPVSDAQSSEIYTIPFTLPFSERRALLLTVDGLLITGSYIVALWVWTQLDSRLLLSDLAASNWLWLAFSVSFWCALGWLFDLYDIPFASRKLATVRRVWLTALILLTTYLVVYFLAPRNSLPRWFALVFLGSTAVSITAWRMAYSTVFSTSQLRQRILIAGAGWSGQTIASLLKTRQDSLYEVVGFIDDDPQKANKQINGIRMLGNSGDLMVVATQHQIGEIIVAVTHDMQADLFQALLDCEAAGLSVRTMSDLYEQLTRRVPVEHINKQWLLDMINGVSAPFSAQRVVKRLFDLTLGMVGIIGFALVLPFVALAIKLDDGGPIFYRQLRAGRGAREFELIKFRTMRVDAEKDGRARWASKNDDRITRVGRFLRKTRLDEFPQMLNILRGEMSIVGPRPERLQFVQELEQQVPFYRSRLVVKPGLTGWAQIHYEYGNSIEDALIKLQYDLYYIRHQSLSLDVYTILKTIGVVVRMGGM